MARLSVLLLPLAFALIAAETAFYVPKSFYVIDQSGAVSAPVMLLGDKSIFRTRRAAFPASSSASASASSSSNSNGYGQTYSSSSSNANSNAGNSYPSHHGGGNHQGGGGYHGGHQGGGAYQGGHQGGGGYSSPPHHNVHPVIPQVVEATLFNRFGEDDGVTGIGLSGTSTGGNGVFSGSSSTVDSDGKVHFSTHTGKF